MSHHCLVTESRLGFGNSFSPSRPRRGWFAPQIGAKTSWVPVLKRIGVRA